MTILEAIEEANSSADIRNFKFARLDEWNSFIDSFEFQDYPAHLLVPFDVPFTFKDPKRHSVIPLQGWILTRISEDADDFRTSKVESVYLEPMRQIAFKFLKYLQRTSIIDDDGTVTINGVIKPEYGFLSTRLFGVSYTINLPIIQGVC